MNYFSSDLFKISLSLVAFLVIYGIVIYLMRNRIIKYVLVQPDEKRLKTYQAFSKVIRLCKILFWILPLFLVNATLNLFMRRYELLFFEISSVVVVFVALLVAFLYIKMILKAVGESLNVN